MWPRQERNGGIMDSRRQWGTVLALLPFYYIPCRARLSSVVCPPVLLIGDPTAQTMEPAPLWTRVLFCRLCAGLRSIQSEAEDSVASRAKRSHLHSPALARRQVCHRRSLRGWDSVAVLAVIYGPPRSRAVALALCTSNLSIWASPQ